MINPFKNFQLKYPPDFALVISGISFLVVLGGLVGGKILPGSTLGWFLAMGAFFSFSVAWKNAHYRYHDKAIYKWVNGWRNNKLSNFFVLVAVGFLIGSIIVFKQNT